MSCKGPVKPGVAFSEQVSVADPGDTSVTCAGHACTTADLVHVSGNTYDLEIEASDIACPGPIEIRQTSTGDLIECWDVAPC